MRSVTDYQVTADAAGEIEIATKPPQAAATGAPEPPTVFHDRSLESTTSENAIAAPGRAAWNDFSPISNAARDALRAAAEVPVPPARFVLWALAAYLAALVPLNWLIFRLLGRVEWAWAAAPVIAAAGTAAVVWSTQLNIGFSRARSEIGIASA